MTHSFSLNNPRSPHFNCLSFRQLSNVQQKQVGMLLGAAVAESAGKSLSGRSSTFIEKYFPNAYSSNEEYSPCFVPLTHPAFTETLPCTDLDFEEELTYQRYINLIMTMGRSRSSVSVLGVLSKWEELEKIIPENGHNWHGTASHVLPIISILSVIYPWADDNDLLQYAKPFLKSLIFPSGSPVMFDTLSEVQSSSEKLPHSSLPSMKDPYFISIWHWGETLLRLGLRILQRNPDAFRNAALRSPQCAAHIFPGDLGKLCHGEAHPISGRKVLDEAIIIRQVLDIVKNSNGFSDGVTKLVRLGGPIRQVTLLGGCLLGARFGVRLIPLDWIKATKNHILVSNMAIEIVQWCWNPMK